MEETALLERDNEEKGLRIGEGLSPTLIQQVRQLSVPIWARGLALTLAVLTTLVAVWLVWSGARSCAFECNERLMESGVKILSIAFVPLLVLVYLVFAETGVRALKRKTKELLEVTVIEALHSEERQNKDHSNEIWGSAAQLLEISGPTAYYQLRVLRQDNAATLNFQLDFNVSKVNVVVFLPWPGPERGQTLAQQIRTRLGPTLEGARHEGYVVDENIGYTLIDGRGHAVLCGRKRLRQDFLWDPGSKLYFAQDLRFFLLSLVQEADDLCREPRP
jgi:hypothetical protein